MDYIEQVENTRWAIAVMTAYYAEEGTALASQVASEYVNEPNGVERLIDGFIHLSARMLLTFEAAGVPRNEALQAVAEQLNTETRDDGLD